MNKPEKIICAAIWFDDGVKHLYTPVNIQTGFVSSGHGHCNALHSAHSAAGTKTLMGLYSKLGISKQVQGFLTDKNRFVTREEGAIIAFEAGQIKKKKEHLFSEDIY